MSIAGSINWRCAPITRTEVYSAEVDGDSLARSVNARKANFLVGDEDNSGPVPIMPLIGGTRRPAAAANPLNTTCPRSLG